MTYTFGVEDRDHQLRAHTNEQMENPDLEMYTFDQLVPYILGLDKDKECGTVIFNNPDQLLQNILDEIIAILSTEIHGDIITQNGCVSYQYWD